MRFNIKRFSKLKDRGTLMSWLILRNLPEYLADDLPRIGWMVSYQSGRSIAAGFIRKLEHGKTGMVEGFITNPIATSEDRNEALNVLLKTLLKEASDLKFKQLVCDTTDKHILDRAIKHGFKTLPNVMLIRKCEGSPI